MNYNRNLKYLPNLTTYILYTYFREIYIFFYLGQCYSAIGARIEAHAKQSGFKIIPMFAGHGIGTYFHGPPDIYHIRNSYIRNMEPGITFTIEPILSEGSDEVFILDDNWTAITADNSRAAQAEHTVLITDTGCEILTI